MRSYVVLVLRSRSQYIVDLLQNNNAYKNHLVGQWSFNYLFTESTLTRWTKMVSPNPWMILWTIAPPLFFQSWMNCLKMNMMIRTWQPVLSWSKRNCHLVMTPTRLPPASSVPFWNCTVESMIELTGKKWPKNAIRQCFRNRVICIIL